MAPPALRIAIAAHMWVAACGQLGGSILPYVDPETWGVWEPTPAFEANFRTWPDEPADDMLVWCKGFIPTANTSGVTWVNDKAVVPLLLPLGLPLPGYTGQCAAIDGRDWAPEAPFESSRPTDSRFGAYVKVNGNKVETNATCGFSHNYCCRKGGCNNAKYGDLTCGPLHCPDEDMMMRRVRCWTAEQGWTKDGVDCATATGTILAVKAYVEGRGGDPCVRPLGVPAPAAKWDIGIVMFPTKRRVFLTGYVDDAPATECYARVNSDGKSTTATLAQLRMPSGDVAQKLVGNSDRPLNAASRITHIADSRGNDYSVLV